MVFVEFTELIPRVVLLGVCASLHRLLWHLCVLALSVLLSLCSSSSASVRPRVVRPPWPLFVLAPSVLVSIRLAAWLLRWFWDLPAVDGVNLRCPLGYLRNGMRRQNGPCQKKKKKEWTLSPFEFPVLPSEVVSLHPGWKSAERERERENKFLQYCSFRGYRAQLISMIL